MNQRCPISDDRVWRRAEIPPRERWIVELGPDDIEELRASTHSVAGRDLEEINADTFALPGLSSRLADLGEQLRHGRGFALLRGAPVQSLSPEAAETLFWGLGSHLGIGVSQSADGDRLGHVIDRGTGETERYYTRGGALEFHMDPADVVGLLCLHSAVSGGASRIVSALAIHNVILEERPDLLEVLYRGFFNSRRAYGEGTSPARVPVFADGGDGAECYLLPITIRQAIEEGFALSGPEQEALDYVAEVAARPALYLDMDFREGDIQFLNNRTILHARTDYVDDPEPERRRHLLRLWLMMPAWPARAEAMAFHSAIDRSGGGVRPAEAGGG